MTLKDFFHVTASTLNAYTTHITHYHIFVDDMQALYFSDPSTCKFPDVANFIEQVHAGMRSDNVFWVLVDVGQSANVRAENESVLSLFHVNDTTLRTLSIPVYPLKKVLRNTVEIVKATQVVRSKRVTANTAGTRVPTDITTGHRIRAQGVAYHRLTAYTGGPAGWEKSAPLFVVHQIQATLRPLINAFNHHDIAIIHDTSTNYKQEVELMLNATFKIPRTQTIEEHILSDDDVIIYDELEHVASFECAVVVYLCGAVGVGAHNHYNITTRARTQLVLIDVNMFNDPPILKDEVVSISWEERGGRFHKL